VFALWSLDLIDDLKKALLDEGVRKIDEWTKRHNLEIVNFEVQKIDPFFNINTFNDLEIAKDYFSKYKF
jgi:molybdopterin-guanine dinucleotide biosynthesis protein A